VRHPQPGEQEDRIMSDENVTLELLGARVLTLTAEVRDLQQRFTGIETRIGAIEARITAMEGRFAVQEERMTRMLALLVRIAERIEVPPTPQS
jgi:septal ring factor EnvC (AmiA/AmiB activator)